MESTRVERLIEKAAQWLASSRRVIAFTGAGVSRESGIPTFREAGSGFWEQYDAQQLATVEGFLQDPGLVWNWYVHRRRMVAAVEPNRGHYALARLEQLCPELTVVTQNIDGLHQRAGSRKVIELHGNIAAVRCFRCEARIESWNDEAYTGTTPPRCESCGSWLRPDVVWFGEQLPEQALNQAFTLAYHCDLMLVVGTSGQVQPAASLPLVARNHGARVVEFNCAPSELTYTADFLLQGPSGEVLPLVEERVEQLLRKAGGL